MQISLKQASEILNLSEDEVMFNKQQGKIQASVDQDTLAWKFDFDDVIKLKDSLDEEKELHNEEE